MTTKEDILLEWIKDVFEEYDLYHPGVTECAREDSFDL